MIAILAAVLLVAGAGALYLAAPHQSLVTARAGKAAILGGAVALAAALVLLLSQMGPATAVFTWTTGLMLAWSLPPVAIAWLRHRKETRR